MSIGTISQVKDSVMIPAVEKRNAFWFEELNGGKSS